MRMIFCVECQTEKECKMINGDRAYAHRRDLYHKNFWQCPTCLNFVGTHHKGEGRAPLGCIPNAQMKKIRQQIHIILDPIWRNRTMTRSEVYKKISDEIGYEYHTGELRTLDEARKVYSIVTRLGEKNGQ